VNVWRQLVPKRLYFYGFVNVMTCQLQMKTEMLQNLLDIEIAYSMLKSGDEGTKDPIDTYYEKLKTELQVCGLNERLHSKLHKTFTVQWTYQKNSVDPVDSYIGNLR